MNFSLKKILSFHYLDFYLLTLFCSWLSVYKNPPKFNNKNQDLFNWKVSKKVMQKVFFDFSVKTILTIIV